MRNTIGSEVTRTTSISGVQFKSFIHLRVASAEGGAQGGDSIERNFKFVLNFGSKNGFRFHFDSETCLNFSVGNNQATVCPKVH